MNLIEGFSKNSTFNCFCTLGRFWCVEIALENAGLRGCGGVGVSCRVYDSTGTSAGITGTDLPSEILLYVPI